MASRDKKVKRIVLLIAAVVSWSLFQHACYAGVIEVRVAADQDDAEEHLTDFGGRAHRIDTGGSDLELGAEGEGYDNQPRFFQQGVDGYFGTVDTEIWRSPLAVDQSAAADLNVDGSAGDFPRQVLMRFENIFGSESAQLSPTDEIGSGALTLEVFNSGNSMNLHRMLQPWDDSNTWNDFGPNGVVADGIVATADPIATTGWVTRGPLYIDVTESLIAWQEDPSSNYGWVFLPTGSNGVDFYSAEGTTTPLLEYVAFNPTILLGDVNHDGTIDAADIDLVFDSFDSSDPDFDLTLDGFVDQLDVDFLVHSVLETEYGDVNLDGIIDIEDFGFVFGNFGRNDVGWADGDANDDDIIDIEDFGFVFGNFGFGTTSALAAAVNSNVVAVPEPSTIVLAAMAVLGVGFITHRRKRTAACASLVRPL